MKSNIFPIIDRKSEVISRIGLSKATFHVRINEGLLPPSISLGDHAVGFLRHEVDAVLAAMAAGQSKADIRVLVAELVEQRQQLPELVKQQNAA